MSAPPSSATSRRARVWAAACALALFPSACSDRALQPETDGPPSPVVSADTTPRPRALWVLCEGSARVLDDPARIEVLLSDAHTLGASDLFVQVLRGGRAWYDATRADAAPYAAIREAHGTDTFQRLIEQAHAEGLRVHAWVNVLSLSHNASAPILSRLGRDAVHVDRRGRSLLDYPDYEVPTPDAAWYRMGTRGVYLDPGSPGVREDLVATLGELVERYPELDGLHLDYIRHPAVLPLIPGSSFGVGLDFGYGEPTRLAFQRDTGLRAPRADSMVNTTRWDEWRRHQVDRLVEAIAGMAREKHPGLSVSAAVIAYLDRAYLSLAQDWPRWLEEGWIDVAVPMAYTRDDRLLAYQLERFGGGAHAERIWVGLGSWLFSKHPTRAAAQVTMARSAGVGGEALFSYDAIAEHRDSLLAVLAAASASHEASEDDGG